MKTATDKAKRNTAKGTAKKRSTPKQAAAATTVTSKARKHHKPTGNPIEDKALKARYLEALARFKASSVAEAEGWDDRYEALGEIIESEPPFYLGGGFKTARAFLKAEASDIDERTARRCIRVARYFEPEDEVAFGVSKLEGLLDYLEAAGGVPLIPAKIHLERQTIKVPIAGKGKHASTTKRFASVSVEELRQATRAARGNGNARPVHPFVKAINAGLRSAKLSSVGVAYRQKKIFLSSIDPSMLKPLAKVLAALKLEEQ